MSGGYFDYQQFRFNDIADQLELLIKTNKDESINEWGDTIGRFYDEKTIERFKTAMFLSRMAFVYAHAVDYLVSGDTGEESFHESLEEDIVKINNEFKQFLDEIKGRMNE